MKNIVSVFLILMLLVSLGFSQMFNQSISGTVTLDEDGSPVSLFTLKIVNTNLPFPIPTIAITDADGYYSVPVMAGTYTISPLDTSFYEPFEISGVTVSANQQVVQDIVLSKKAPDAIIAGTVTLNSQPVENAEIKLYRIFGTNSFSKSGQDLLGATYTAVTDADGNFSVDVVHGSYFLYIPPTGNWMPYWSSDIFVAAGETTQLDIQLEEQPLRTIAGTVYNYDAFDFVIFSATNLDTNFRSQSFLMNSSGEYSIKAYPGRIMLSCTGISDGTVYNLYYGDVLSPDQAEIINLSGDTTGIDFTFPTNISLSTVTITGKVLEEGTLQPIEMAKVRFKSEDAGFSFNDTSHFMPYVYTDANGEYSISGSTYFDTVTVYSSASMDGYFTEFYDNQSSLFTATPITVAAGDTTSGIDFSLTPISGGNTYSISGTVMGEDGMVPDYGSVIALTNVGTKYAETDADGSYIIEGLPAGAEVRLQAWGFPGYLPIYYDNAYSWHDATVITMDENKVIDFTLPAVNLANSVGSVGGEVTLSAGNNEGATIYIKKNNSNIWYSADYSDVDGRFNLPIESYGTYELFATAQGYNDYQGNIIVDESTGLFLNDLQFNMTPTSITDGPEQVVQSNVLYAAYPNPFNPSTTIKIDMARNEFVELFVFNILGQKVKALHDGVLEKGAHKFTWDGKDQTGRNVASGLYFYQMKSESSVKTRSMLLMK